MDTWEDGGGVFAASAPFSRSGPTQSSTDPISAGRPSASLHCALRSLNHFCRQKTEERRWLERQQEEGFALLAQEAAEPEMWADEVTDIYTREKWGRTGCVVGWCVDPVLLAPRGTKATSTSTITPASLHLKPNRVVYRYWRHGSTHSTQANALTDVIWAKSCCSVCTN